MLDICIIFGILQNVIANVEFNILFLDELFTNLDSQICDMLLETIGSIKEKSIFIINHSNLKDDFFKHKIQVSLENKKINKENIKKCLSGGQVIVHSSKYNMIY